ncbi:hypothetical protein A3D88_03565 [Candidatus Peribacteria bacterium RIFCSPHIGHO2_02_FULL_52_16]|nr:MAG: hypothetical protein A2706_04380 [Candidatus Peribacteria bacterium RIFCSPHIGHO2_01_FULL_51_35]OGJ61762.1 MAG: hypothetical protein A3D88_03565 [Candidatus Peribacteria bacterium RIFCSPHIGHO2_02_FULL_52_16]
MQRKCADSLLLSHFGRIRRGRTRLFPPFLINYAKSKSCLVDGCKGRTYGKTYCVKHFKQYPVTITAQARLLMKSDCHGAACVSGEKHDYGSQYCAACKQACQWKKGG